MLAYGSSVAAPRNALPGHQLAALPRLAYAGVCRSRLSAGQFSHLTPVHPVPSTCRNIKIPIAASAAAATLYTSELQPCTTQQQQQQLGIFEALRRCRAVFSCLAFCAVYALLSWGSAPGAPFASAALTLGPDAQSTGITSAAKSAWAGLAAGFLHTLCGPDHLAALTPLTIGRPRWAASALGALWGFGHSTGQLILGLVFVVLKERFHDLVPLLSKWAGVVVPLTLIAIGLMGVYESCFEGPTGHQAAEQEAEAVGLAVAGGGSIAASVPAASSPSLTAGLRSGLGTYATGIVYGLQPDALFVVVPALALPTKLAALSYCSSFVVGTVAAMGGYTLVIGTTSQALIREQPWLQRHLSTLASGVAIVVGLVMLAGGLGLQLPGLG
ncbi:hypothetical protein Agub_g5679 [Astrephomene gubernaculifera]|uniref:Urease accessory protein UreH-like transmembrane domain-containing protein n=1 Tax=Astrephomene gubernaculifera TaxID=47775 RepID=A0AAD3DM83_9CHLO|nr:hypothetical protein Agub_g5679 [Astrephomene gubernaculifera]